MYIYLYIFIYYIKINKSEKENLLSEKTTPLLSHLSDMNYTFDFVCLFYFFYFYFRISLFETC